MRRMVLAGAVAMLSGASAPPAERVVAGDGIADVVVNGVPARLRVDPAAPGMPLITQGLAERLDLKLTGSWGIGIGYSVGGTGVMSRTQVVRLDYGTGAAKRRVGWTSRPFAAVADGSVGPDALPEAVIRFQLRPAQPDEREVSLPAVRTTGPLGLFGHFGATFGEARLGDEPLRIRFDPHHPRTLATAGAAVRLARLHGGAVSGEPVQTEIFFGVERPVRTLTLDRPFMLGPMAIGTLGVRTADGGSAAALREASAPPPTPDPDEIVVTGRARKRDVRRDVVSLGADYLARCSSIVFDKAAQRITLRCR